MPVNAVQAIACNTEYRELYGNLVTINQIEEHARDVVESLLVKSLHVKSLHVKSLHVESLLLARRALVLARRVLVLARRVPIHPVRMPKSHPSWRNSDVWIGSTEVIAERTILCQCQRRMGSELLDDAQS